MAIFSFMDPILDAAFGWLLNLPPFWAILIISFIISVGIVLIYKYTTNQSLMKSLKDEIKSLQKEMKTLKDQPDKLMKVNKRAMEVNMKYMAQSLKPMIFTLLPILLIFGWLNGHLAYDPINPGDEFAVEIEFAEDVAGNITAIPADGLELTSKSTKSIKQEKTLFTFEAVEAGTYGIEFEIDGQSYSKDVLVTDERKYLEPIKKVDDGTVEEIVTQHEKAKIIKIGDFGITWLWSYIIFSLIFSISLRRLLKVY